MLKYIIKRLGLSIIILVGVSMIIYFLVRLMPTDYLENSFSAQLGQGTITMEQINDFKALYGLADNSFLGILKGYFGWLGNLFKGDLGTSFIYKKDVSSIIAENMWI